MSYILPVISIGNNPVANSSMTGFNMAIMGSNNVTLAQSVNGLSQTLFIEAPPMMAISASNGSIQAATITFGNANGISFLTSNGSIVGSFSQSFQPVGSFGVSNIGNTSGVTGTVANQMILAGGNNITLSQSTNTAGITVTVSAPNQSVVPQNASLFALGATTQNSSTVLSVNALSLNGLGGISVGYSNGSIQLSGRSTVFLSGSNGAVSNSGFTFGNLNNVSFYLSGLSMVASFSQTDPNMRFFALGNTTQNSSTVLPVNAISFNGLGIVTVGYSNGSIQLSATQSNQNISLFALGNTTQNSSTVLNASNLSFNGLGIASVGYSNGSIQISVPAGAPSPVNFSAGTTSNDLASVVFSNSNGVSFGLDGSTITASVNVPSSPVQSFYQNVPTIAGTAALLTVNQISQIWPITVFNPLTIGYVRFPLTMGIFSGTFATADGMTASLNIEQTINFQLYSQNSGASSLSLSRIFYTSVGITQQASLSANATAGSRYSVSYSISYPVTGGTSSFSTSFALSNASVQLSTGSISNFTGWRNMDMPMISSLAPGVYYPMVGNSTALTTAGVASLSSLRWTGSNIAVTQININLGELGEAFNGSWGFQPGVGSFSTAGAVTTASMGFSNISTRGSHALPVIQFLNFPY